MRVLIVEDDFHSRELLRLRLENLGCSVLEAATAQEALERVAAERPDLVFLDLKLQGNRLGQPFEGAEVLARLRENPTTAAIPVVIHSIYVRHPAEAPAALPDADGFLVKPFRLDELKVLLEKYRLLVGTQGKSAS